MRKFYFTVILIGLFLLSGCSDYDSDYIPYKIKAYNVYVYDNSHEEKEYYAGRIETNYRNREAGLSSCGSVATTFANQMNFEEWGYICCTETDSSTCATKVR